MTKKSTARMYTQEEYGLIKKLNLRNLSCYYKKEVLYIHRKSSSTGVDYLIIRALMKNGVIKHRKRIQQSIYCEISPEALKWVGVEE